MIKDLFTKFQEKDEELKQITNEMSKALGKNAHISTSSVIVDDILPGMIKMIVFESSGVTYQAWETSIDGVKVVYYEAL